MEIRLVINAQRWKLLWESISQYWEFLLESISTVGISWWTNFPSWKKIFKWNSTCGNDQNPKEKPWLVRARRGWCRLWWQNFEKYQQNHRAKTYSNITLHLFLLLTKLTISLLPFMWIMVSSRNEEKDEKLNNGDDIQLYPYNLLRSKWLILSIITTCNAIFE